MRKAVDIIDGICSSERQCIPWGSHGFSSPLDRRICFNVTLNHCSIFPSIHRSIHPLVHPSVYTSIDLCIHWSIHPSVTLNWSLCSVSWRGWSLSQSITRATPETLNAMRGSNTFTHIHTSTPPRAKSACQAVFQGQREAGIWTEATQTQSPNGQVLMSKQTGPAMGINCGPTHTCHDITHLSQHATTRNSYRDTTPLSEHNVPVTTCYNTINPSIHFLKMHILLLKHHRELAWLLVLN